MGSSTLTSMRVAAVVFLALCGTAVTKTVPQEDRQLPDLGALTGLLGLLSGGGASGDSGANLLSTLLGLLDNNGATGESGKGKGKEGKGGKGLTDIFSGGKGGKGDLLSGLLGRSAPGEDRQLPNLEGRTYTGKCRE